MHFDLSELSPNRVYYTMIQTLVPRPIAWVLTDNGNDSFNLAPFSYFNGVASDPPLLMISVGKKPDGTLKDTRTNIIERNEFVRWFDLMGVQRHLKASGIFARLSHRDGKQNFLEDIPRTLSYILDLKDTYKELEQICIMLEELIMPKLREKE